MSIVPFVHVSFTLAIAFGFHVCMSPPSGTLPPSALDKDGFPENDRHTRIYITARFITGVITKGFYWGSAITHTLVSLAPHVPTSLRHISLLIPTSIPTAPLSWIPQIVSKPTLPLLTMTGATLVLSGVLLRVAAYRALGQFYACPPGPGPCPSLYRGPNPYTHRGARHVHPLVTSGPYAFLRHPGYAGLLLSTIGFVILHLDHTAVDSNASVSRWCVGVKVGDVDVGHVCAMMRAVALIGALLAAVGAIKRIQYEERGLRERFKVEWELWAERVSYKLVPGVY